MTKLTLDAVFQDTIDLQSYLTEPNRKAVADLYKTHGWPFEPSDAWHWRFEDVCALYFRARRHAEVFGPKAEQKLALYAIYLAIMEYLSDEFS